MDDFKKEILFLQLIAKNEEKKQTISLLKQITKNQYNILKNIAFKILTKQIIINKSDYKRLSLDKSFIRKLGNKKVTTKVLIKHLKTVQHLVNIVIRKYAAHTKIGFSSSRRMGKNKKQKFKRNKTNSDSDSNETRCFTKSINNKQYTSEIETSENSEQEEEENIQSSDTDSNFTTKSNSFEGSENQSEQDSEIEL